MMIPKYMRVLFLALFFMGIFHLTLGQEPDKGEPTPGNALPRIKLIDAVMCEGIKDGKPQNAAVIFSKSHGEVICFTTFDDIQENTFIYHKWFFRDVLNRTTRLIVNPPRWSTYSSIHVRESDKGPWHVEITDEQGYVFQILRFSIVE